MVQYNDLISLHCHDHHMIVYVPTLFAYKGYKGYKKKAFSLEV